MFVYNISLTILFWSILNLISSNFKTLHFFSGFSLNPFYLFTVTVLLFSMAGVPPFVGFFSKLFLIILLTSSNFFLLYSIFFITLFLGLYFYVQNIRFLHTTNLTSFDYQYTPSVNERSVILFFYISIFTLLLIILGFSYIDDLLLIFTWLLI
jgi:NADH:ubiquinone oxidoreductase subunit 2 (subunit N)